MEMGAEAFDIEDSEPDQGSATARVIAAAASGDLTQVTAA